MRTETTLVGRGRERARVRAFLSDHARPAALVIEGEPGIGKTALWQDAVAAARAMGDHVSSCRPAESESQLPFAAVADLLAGVPDGAFAALPAVQRRALRVALLLDEPDGPPPDTRAIASAFVGALRNVPAAVVLAIDDAQWLDGASRSVLAFALRRLEDEPVAVLVARRGGGPPPLGLERADRLALAPLGLGALHTVLHDRLGLALPRPLLRRVHDAVGGNPFYALELGRALAQREALPRADEPLPVPDSLVAQRVAALPEDVHRLLEIVSALFRPRTSELMAIARDEGIDGALDRAVASGLLEVAGERVAFSHPLVAAGVYARIGPERRRELHGTLAARGGDGEARALHLALGTDVPDAAIAAELDAAAAHAAARGAAATAAQLSEAAARLTPDREQADRRLIAAAEHQLAAGDQAAGRALLAGVIERGAPGPVRAAALSMLSWLGPDGSDLATAARLGEQALAEAGDDERLKATILLRLAVIEEIRGRAGVSAGHRRAAVGLAEAGGDAALLANALAALGHSRLVAGDGVSAEARRAVEIERSLPRFLGGYGPSIALGQGLLYSDRFDEARGVLRDVFERATDAGHEEARAAILFHLADLERRAGNWRDAVPLSDRARTLYRQAGNEQEYASCLVVGALLDAGMGRVEEARRDARAGLAAAERIGDETFRIHHLAVLGFVELSLGDAAEAARWLGPATDLLRRRGTAELSIYPAVHNEIDALAALGRLDRAQELVGWLERLAAATGRTWTAAMAARGRATILAAGGDVEAALASAQRAAGYDAQPFEHARTLLLLGALERRARRKRRSREALERAAAIFAALPAPLWEARAVAELARLGTRADPGALTETEARIAELAATGMTNPEIAATVFVSRKTVEANLSRVYAKLGVRSRVELARTLPRRLTD